MLIERNLNTPFLTGALCLFMMIDKVFFKGRTESVDDRTERLVTERHDNCHLR